jgi:hypothetical protein
MNIQKAKSIDGQPRYIIHFSELLNDNENKLDYNLALKKSRIIGGRKYSYKYIKNQIAFISDNEFDLEQQLNKIKQS